MRKSKIFSKIATFALAGVMAVSVCGTVMVAKASTADEEIVVEMDTPINEHYFPDENFRNYVLENIDSDKNGALNREEKTQVTEIKCSGLKITDITGVELFTSLETLDCSNNNLTNLDMSNLQYLKKLHCQENNLTTLNLSENTSLESLRYSNINDLDISKNTNLTTLVVQGEDISKIDITSNTKLTQFTCFDTKISSIDLSKNTELVRLFIYRNKNLTELDLGSNLKLGLVECYSNNLNKLEFGNGKNLGRLICNYNNLSELDVTKQTELVQFDCSNNSLKVLDVSNNTKLEQFNCSNNQLTTLNVSGLEKLPRLYCFSNQLNSLIFGNNDALTYVSCEVNLLTSLDLSNAKNLEGLFCSNNLLTCLDVSRCPELEYLYIELNQIEAIKLNDNSEIEVYGMEEQITGVRNNEDGTVTNILGTAVIINKNIETIILDKTNIDVEKGENLQLTATVTPSDADLTTVHWTSSNPSVATVDENGWVTAKATGSATITATAADMSGVTANCTVSVTSRDSGNTGNTDTTDIKNYPAVNISYRTHIQTFGWEGDANDITTWKSNGTMSGTSGLAKRLEGINVVVDSADSKVDLDLGIQYTTHCQSYGWLPWSADGDMNGTEGEAKRLEAIMIQLTGADAKYYDVYYRVHAQTYGWLGWASNGAPAGTAGYAKRLEGIQIVVVKKGESFNQKMGDITSAKIEAFVAKAGDSPIVNYPATSNTNPIVPGENTPNVAYRTHVQSYGWQGWKYNGQMSGTSGEAKRLEGININLTNKDYAGGIVYTTHVQSYGWQGKLEDQSTWKKNGEMSGTSGEAKRLEAICINLTGEMANHYDIYYRVHAQSYGWLGWAKNGAPAGTAGYGKRLEGIQIVLVPKGGAAPTNHGGIESVDLSAYVEK